MRKTCKKSYKKKSNNAPYKKFAWRTQAVAFPSRPSVGLGCSTTTVLKTCFFANAQAAAGTGIYTGYLKPGSAFDPTGDLSTIQPQLFDQFAAIYNRYKVNTCRIFIRIIGQDALTNSASAGWVAAAYPSVDSTALTTYQAAASQQYAKTTAGSFAVCYTGAASVGAGSEGKTLTFNLKHDAVVGTPSAPWDIGALVSADPTALQYMLLPIFLQASAATAAKWLLQIDMTQNVTFSQKKNTVDA